MFHKTLVHSSTSSLAFIVLLHLKQCYNSTMCEQHYYINVSRSQHKPLSICIGTQTMQGTKSIETHEKWRQTKMYVVHPYLGVTSTKGCCVPATFISLESYNLQQKCCHPFLLNLTRSHLGSNSSGN